MDTTRFRAVHQTALLYSLFNEWSAEAGITLSIEQDFEEFETIVRGSTAKPPFPVFNPNRSDICEQSGLWIKGTDENGKVVHLQALRLWDLSGSSLSAHLRRHVHLYCFEGHDFIDPKITRVNGMNCDSITGRVAYHGQIWVDPQWRGKVVNGFPLGRELLPRIATAICYLAMMPDYIFGMAPYPTAEKGLLASYGFYHADLAALTFFDKSGEFLWHESILWQSADEIAAEIMRTLERCPQDKLVLPSQPVAIPSRGDRVVQVVAQ